MKRNLSQYPFYPPQIPLGSKHGLRGMENAPTHLTKIVQMITYLSVLYVSVNERLVQGLHNKEEIEAAAPSSYSTMKLPLYRDPTLPTPGGRPLNCVLLLGEMPSQNKSAYSIYFTYLDAFKVTAGPLINKLNQEFITLDKQLAHVACMCRAGKMLCDVRSAAAETNPTSTMKMTRRSATNSSDSSPDSGPAPPPPLLTRIFYSWARTIAEEYTSRECISISSGRRRKFWLQSQAVCLGNISPAFDTNVLATLAFVLNSRLPEGAVPTSCIWDNNEYKLGL